MSEAMDRLKHNREVAESLARDTYPKLSDKLTQKTSMDVNMIEIVCTAHGLTQVLNANKSLLDRYAKEAGYDSVREMPSEEYTPQIREVLLTVVVTTIMLQRMEDTFYEATGTTPEEYSLEDV